MYCDQLDADLMPAFVPERQPGPLTQEDAIQIWIARAARVRIRELTLRYGIDARRLYEIWRQERFPAAREAAIERLRETEPCLAESIRLLPHVATGKTDPEDQLELFEG